MNKVFNRMTVPMVFLLVGILLFMPFFRMTLKADTLGESFLFLERMQVDTATSMTIAFTPGESFDAGSTFRIFFPQDEVGADEWCLQDDTSFTSITGTDEAPVEQGEWTINAALPGTLAATCNQGEANENDFIEVTGIGALTGGQTYGFVIAEQAALFKTGDVTGNNTISFQLESDDETDVENLTFGINLIASDQVTVTVTVLDVDTITCEVGANVTLPALFPGGTYVTGNHTLGTTAVGSGFYWTVYGHGNGSTEAGLYLESPEYLLSSESGGGTVNLITGEGFGLEFSTVNAGTPEADYNGAGNGTGIFGEITRDPILILQSATADSGTNTVTLGARAGADAESGSYTETLTYVCGAYVGDTTP